MTKVYATLTSKGQLTIPRALREAWKLAPGDRLLIDVEGPEIGRFAPARRRSIFEGIDTFSSTLGHPLTQADIDDALDEGAAERGRPERGAEP